MNLAKSMWAEMLPVIEPEVSTITFDLWIKPLEPVDVDENKLVLLAPTERCRDTINRSLRPVINRVLSTVNVTKKSFTFQAKNSSTILSRLSAQRAARPSTSAKNTAARTCL